MDYLKLLKGLKKEFFEKGRAQYEKMPFIARLIFTLFFIPWRIGFFFARLGYWFTWFFFKALAAPVDYLQCWLDKQRTGAGDIGQAVIFLVCLPTIFYQHVLLAFNAFSFFFQWFGLMLNAYIMTLGAIRWQPVITEAEYDEEVATVEVNEADEADETEAQ